MKSGGLAGHLSPECKPRNNRSLAAGAAQLRAISEQTEWERDQ